MLRTRLLFLVVACALLAFASWADDLGYIDCSNHPDTTQVLDKAGMTSGVVAVLPCGERFTVLARGEFYSQVKTKDGKVGYLLTYLITPVAAAAKPQAAPAQTSAPSNGVSSKASAASDFKIISPQPAAAPPSVSSSSASAEQPAPPAPAQPAPASNAPASISGAPSPTPLPSAPQPVALASTQTEVAASTSASAAQPPAPTQATASAVSVAPQPLPTPPPASTAPSAAQPQLNSPAPTENPPSPPASAASTSAPATQSSSAPAVQPESAASPEPQPVPAPPIFNEPQIHPKQRRAPQPFPEISSVPKFEAFAGYGFTRFGSGANASNLNGALGSFGVNFKPWLQIMGDASYNFVTVNGTKSVVYGDHFGPRIFLRSRSARGPIPFVEALVGGTRIDTTTAGVTVSDNGLSYKAGGGVDLTISRHLSVRLVDADYYRIPFFTNSQSNYSFAVGIVFRFGGGGRTE